MPFLFSWVGAEAFELSHVLFKHSSVNKMLAGLGKQTMLLVAICWQHTLRQCHLEWCGHLQLHRIWAGLCMCKDVLRPSENHLAGWLQSDVNKDMNNSSWHFAQLEGSATYCQADNCNMGHINIRASKRNSCLSSPLSSVDWCVADTMLLPLVAIHHPEGWHQY
ncbi:hypothetical protein ABBQ38_007682 [Trebouxia sp. C0009 RCD-2024]